MDRKAMYKLSYGLFVLTAREDGKDNGAVKTPLTEKSPRP